MLYYNIFQILTQLLSTHLLKLNLWHLVKIKRKQDTKYTKKNRNNPNYVYWTNCCMYIFLYKLQQINATCNQYMFEKQKKKTASYSWRLLETMNEWVSWHSFVFQIWYTKQRCDPRQTHAAISTDKFTPNLKLTTGGWMGRQACRHIWKFTNAHKFFKIKWKTVLFKF